MRTLEQKLAALRADLRRSGRVLVCFSGGVDSGLLLALAVEQLGAGAVALTGISPSLEAAEEAGARRFAQQLGVRHLCLPTDELASPDYTANPDNRCYFCKSRLYRLAARVAHTEQLSEVLDGFNVDDRGDYRPGRAAARERGVRSPLDEHGLTKACIREAARQLGLALWDKPALACLASRIPHGTAVTVERLDQIARAERVVRAHGFRVVRVRHFDREARIEVGAEELERADARVVAAISAQLREIGFARTVFDPRGYRRGSLNVVQHAAGGSLP